MSTFTRSNWNLEYEFLWREENFRTWGEKPTCDTMSGNQTWVTVVGSGCPHHCAIPASQSSTGKRIALPVQKFYLPVFFK